MVKYLFGLRCFWPSGLTGKLEMICEWRKENPFGDGTVRVCLFTFHVVFAFQVPYINQSIMRRVQVDADSLVSGTKDPRVASSKDSQFLADLRSLSYPYDADRSKRIW